MSAVVRITDEIAPTIARKLDDIGKSAKTAGQGVSSLQSEMNKLKLNSLNIKLGISEQLARDMAAIRRAHQEKLNLMQQEARARADLDRRLTQGADTALKRIQAATAAAQRQRFVLEQQMDQQRTTRALQGIRTREAAERAASRTLEQQQRQQSRAAINGINEQIARGRLAHAERTNWLKEEAALEKAVTDVAINQDKRKASAQKATHDQKMRDLRLQTQATLDAGRIQIQNDRVQRQLSRPAFVGGGGGGGRSSGGGRSGGFFGLGGASTEFRGVRTAIESATIAALNFRTILYTLGVGFSLRGVLNEFRQLSDIQQKLTASFGKDKAPGMFEKLVGVSNETGSGIKENAFLLQRFRNATQDLDGGKGLDENVLLGYVKRFNELSRLSGASMNEMANSALQLSQAMNADRLQGDELRSVMENNPALFTAIAKAMNLTRTELVQATRGTDEFGRAAENGAKASEELLTVMGPLGKAITVVGKESKETQKFVDSNGRTFNVLKSDLVKAANGVETFGDQVKKAGGKIVIMGSQIRAGLGSASDEMVRKLKDIPLTIDQSFNVLSNNLFNLLNNFDRQTGIVGKLSEAVKILSNNVGLLSDAFIVLGVVAVPLVIAAFSKLAAGLLLNPFGLLGIGLGVTTAYLIAFRNEIGFDAQGALVFEKAVISLADAFRILGSAIKGMSLGDFAKQFDIGLGGAAKGWLDAYKAVGAYEEAQIKGAGPGANAGAIGGGNGFSVRGGQSVIGDIGADTAVGLLGFLKSPLVGTVTTGFTALNATIKATQNTLEDYVNQGIQASDMEEKRISTINRMNEATGKITKEMVAARAEKLRAFDDKAFKESISDLSSGERLLLTQRRMNEQQLRSRDYQKELEGFARGELEFEAESLRIAREKARIKQTEREQVRSPLPAAQTKADPFTQDSAMNPTQAFTTLVEKAKAAGQKIKEGLNLDGIGQQLKSNLAPAGGVVERLGTAAGAAVNKFTEVMTTAQRIDQTITNIRADIAGTIAEVTSILGSVVSEIERVVLGALRAIQKMVNEIIGLINQIRSSLGLSNLSDVSITDSLGQSQLGLRAAAAKQRARDQVFDSPTDLFQRFAGQTAGNQAIGAGVGSYFGQGQGPLQQYQAQLGQTNKAVQDLITEQSKVGPSAQQNFGQAAQAAGQLGQASQDVGQLMQQFIGSTLSNLENAFVQFAQTGKIDFKSLMNSIIADLARMFFRMIIMQPIMMFFQSFLGGFGGGLFGFASGGLVGGGGGSFNSFGGGGGLNSLAPASTGGFSNFGGIGIGGGGSSCGPGGCGRGGFATGGLVGDFKGFASGGMTSGPGTSTSDRLLTLTSPGEFIVNAAATKANLPVLNYINEGGAMGGGGGTAVSYAPNIVVNVQGGGSAVAGIQQGQMAGKELDAIMRKSFSEMLVRELRPGGTLNQG